MSQSMTSAHPVIRVLCLWPAVLAVLLSGAGAKDGVYRNSPHGSTEHGVYRLVDTPRGSCAQCHSAHDVSASQPFGLFVPNSNELCFSASAGGCHADQPSGATSGYPAQESDRLPIGSADPGYFEFNSAGVRVPGVDNLVRWPGRVVWENGLVSSHFSDQDMPIKDYFGNGACDNCHAVHGSGSAHDMLDTTSLGIVGSEQGVVTDNYGLCLSCHNFDGPLGMEESSRSIGYYYDRSINPGSGSGHGVSTGGSYVPSGARLPCYDCHNPHGSVGYASQGPNSFLLSDQRIGWYDLTDIRNDNNQVRRFCFGCHPSSDKLLPADPVEGLLLSPLPPSVSAHEYNATTHCYDCHGRDYSSPTANNVHNPSPGGDCVTCHGTEQGQRRAVVDEFGRAAHHVFAIGQSGSVTNEDCVVCHMEGSAITTAPDQTYHANGLLDLRDPDLGTALPGFESLTRDRFSPMLETWVTDVQNQFCLRCHDINGAMSPASQVPGGTALSPFSDQNAVAIDVASQFAPANSAYHPVLAPGNNPYTVPSSQNGFKVTMLPPFNQSSNHDLISCFDCHETNGHGSTNSGMLLDETYFREPMMHPSFGDSQRAFCGRCHDENVYVFGSEGSGTRFEQHDEGPHSRPQGGAQNQQTCRGCHAGIYDSDQDGTCDNGSRIGTIHGIERTWTVCSATAGQRSEKFLVGGYLNGWEDDQVGPPTCYANCHHPSGETY